MKLAEMKLLSPVIGAFLQSRSVQGRDSCVTVGRYRFQLPSHNRTDLWVSSGKKTVNRIRLEKLRDVLKDPRAKTM